eukprot:m51a1_g2726 hypothetical protein (236) ;mRNA; r:868349-872124
MDNVMLVSIMPVYIKKKGELFLKDEETTWAWLCEYLVQPMRHGFMWGSELLATSETEQREAGTATRIGDSGITPSLQPQFTGEYEPPEWVKKLEISDEELEHLAAAGGRSKDEMLRVIAESKTLKFYVGAAAKDYVEEDEEDEETEEHCMRTSVHLHSRGVQQKYPVEAPRSQPNEQCAAPLKSTKYENESDVTARVHHLVRRQGYVVDEALSEITRCSGSKSMYPAIGSACARS